MLRPPNKDNESSRDANYFKTSYRAQKQRPRPFHQTSITVGTVESTDANHRGVPRHSRKTKSTDDIERGVLKKRPSEVSESYDERMYSSKEESGICSSFSEQFVLQTRQSGWRALNELGHGANGTVWRVMRESTGAMAAMKVISRTNQTDRSVEKVHREIEMLKKMDHVNIVKYLDSEITEYDFRIYMELVSGGTLYNLLGHKKLEGKLVEKFTKQIARGLEYLHTQNVVHRDIKSANVLVGKHGVCKLADFGASVQMQGSFDFSKLCSSLQGTPLYMPPEITQGRKYGKKSDIWSFGITVFEMLTGKPPFYDSVQDARNVAEQFVRITWRFAQVEKPIEVDHLEDPDIRDFLSSCFHLDPEKRDSIDKLLVHDWMNRESPNTSVTRPFQSKSLSLTKKKKKSNDCLKMPVKKLWFWVLVVIVTCLVGGVIYLVVQAVQNSQKNHKEDNDDHIVHPRPQNS